MFIVTHRKIFYLVSATLVGASILALVVWGLPLGIDFKGGAILELGFTGNRPEVSVVEEALRGASLTAVSIREVGDDGYLIRLHELSESQKAALIEGVKKGAATVEVRRSSSIGPVLGREAGSKSLWSIILVIVAILGFITFAFRKVSESISSWIYGVITIVALIHDVLIPTGVFAVLGKFASIEVDTLFVTALLVILGFSVHDTIVVFDRVRENLRRNREEHQGKDFFAVVGGSVSETFTRSVNTSLTTLLALVAIYLLAGESVRYFALALIIGIVAGTYSSICIASPLLVTMERLRRKG